MELIDTINYKTEVTRISTTEHNTIITHYPA